MGIVQKQRKKIENLETKNRMLKRMYETQKAAAAKAMVAENGAEQVVKAAIFKCGGTLVITRDKLEELKKVTAYGAIEGDLMIYSLSTVLAPEQFGELVEHYRKTIEPKEETDTE